MLSEFKGIKSLPVKTRSLKAAIKHEGFSVTGMPCRTVLRPDFTQQNRRRRRSWWAGVSEGIWGFAD